MSTTADAGAVDPPVNRLRNVSLGRYSALILLALFFVYFGLIDSTTKDVFTDGSNIKVTLAARVTIGFLTLGLLVPLAAGIFDLSIGAMMGFASMVLAWIEQENRVPGGVFGASVVTILICMVFGWVNGFLVVKLNINSFIATLGMSQVITAAMLWRSDNQRIADVFSDEFQDLGRKEFLTQSLSVWYLLGAAIVIWYMLEYTPFGRKLFATGGNPDAARLAGVRTGRYIWTALIISSVMAALGGIVFDMRQGAASPQTGPPLLFPAFAAVFFGATQIRNRPNVWGTMIAIVTLAFGAKGLQLKSPGVWVEPLFNGLALAIAVAFASYQGGLRLRRKRDPEVPSGNLAATVSSRTDLDVDPSG